MNCDITIHLILPSPFVDLRSPFPLLLRRTASCVSSSLDLLCAKKMLVNRTSIERLSSSARKLKKATDAPRFGIVANKLPSGHPSSPVDVDHPKVPFSSLCCSGTFTLFLLIDALRIFSIHPHSLTAPLKDLVRRWKAAGIIHMNLLSEINPEREAQYRLHRDSTVVYNILAIPLALAWQAFFDLAIST